MATTYEATDRETNEVVAVELVPRQAASPDHLRRDFEIGAQLSHSGVLVYLAFIESDEYLGIVSEPVGSLRSFDKSHVPDADNLHSEARNAFTSLYETLNYLHGQSLVHGNITPETVLIDPSGNSRLFAFGHCVSLSGTFPNKGAGFHGTPAYSSPEHQTNEVVEASDYFVFGILLFEHLARERFFSAIAPEELFKQIMNIDARMSLSGYSRVSERYRPALESLLARAPHDRRKGWETLPTLWSGA